MRLPVCFPAEPTMAPLARSVAPPTGACQAVQTRECRPDTQSPLEMTLKDKTKTKQS